jgi:outer membrane protein TolC
MRKMLAPVLALMLVHESAMAQPAAPAITTRTPTPPPVDDPMLAPAPPAKQVLSSWQDAVSRINAASVDLRIVKDQILAAEGASRVALAQYLPTIVGVGRYAHQFLVKSNPTGVLVTTAAGDLAISGEAPLPNVFDVTLRAQQTILNVAALDQIGIAKLGEDLTRLSADNLKRTLVVTVADRIIAVITAEKAAEISRVGLRMALEQAAIVRNKHDLGGATQLDVIREDENVETARAALVEGDEALREARAGLGLALGSTAETGVAPGLDVNGVAGDIASSCRRVESLDDRPDVAAARANIDIAKRNLRNVWFSFLPTVTVQSSLYETSVVPLGYPNPTWSIVGILTVPIWDGGARYGTLRVDRAEADIAALELERLRRQILVEVEHANRGLVLAQSADDIARRQRDLTARDEALTLVSYVTGAASSLELVTASEAHREAELALVLRDYGLVKARLTADLALATCPL